MYITGMVRTQIYLPETLHRALGRAARRRGVSMAELIREGAALAVTEAQEKADPFDELIGIDDRGPAQMAERHDEYLTGLRARRRSRRSKPSR
jgi:hypothetical protein